MITNLIAAVSAFGSAFALADFFLSKSAKDRISNYLISAWFKLSTVKGWSILPWLRTGWHRLLFSLAVVGCMAACFYAIGIRDKFVWVLMPIVLVPVLAAGFDVVENIIEDGILFSLATTIFVCVFFGILTWLFPGGPWSLFLSLGVLLVAFNLLAVLPMIGIRLAMYFLKGCELTLRRMAEYEKGPVLACSVVLGTIAAGVKAFLG